MCGIAGICNLEGSKPISAEAILKMTNSLSHRGPDEVGIYLDDSVGLGHTRLSIIDLAGGSQPIRNEDGTLWIVYNGEIFNYLELKEDLVTRGHRFYTSTDTEVILHLFEENGPLSLNQLNGQFAFAIWNAKSKEMFLARDRVGIRPLHYTIRDQNLIFASEIKSIFMNENVPRRIDPIAMDQIFTFWTTLPGRTVFQGIHELPPGHCMQVRNGEVRTWKYWDLPFSSGDNQIDWPVEKLCEEIHDLLNDAIRIRLRADVPVGCYLSGGLDSSAVTTLVRNNFNNQLRTFGIRFEEGAYDESKYQDCIVAALKTEHTDIRATNNDIGRIYPDVIWHCEKPLLRTAPVPLFMLSNAVRTNGFKVVLTGEGADEVFGGYNIFRETLVRKFWSRRPESRLRPLLIGKLYPYIFNDSRLKHTLQAFFAHGIENTEDPFFSHRIRWENTSKLKAFFSSDVKASIGLYSGYEELKENLPESFKSMDALSKAQYLEMQVFLSNYLLSSQGDRVAMAHSVEIRLPYLDYRIIEFMGRVPPKWKIRGLKEKYLLKKGFQGILPDMILNRPKHPYRAPIVQSLLSDENTVGSDDVMSQESIGKAGLFDADRVGKLLAKLHRTGHATEVEGMALAGIQSSQYLLSQFVSLFPYKTATQAYPTTFVDRRTANG